MNIEDLFEEENTSCDNIWILSLILLILFNGNFNRKEPRISIYINEGKEGE